MMNNILIALLKDLLKAPFKIVGFFMKTAFNIVKWTVILVATFFIFRAFTSVEVDNGAWEFLWLNLF